MRSRVSSEAYSFPLMAPGMLGSFLTMRHRMFPSTQMPIMALVIEYYITPAGADCEERIGNIHKFGGIENNVESHGNDHRRGNAMK